LEDIHQNYDPVFKEAMVLFQDKALDFLGLTGIAPITEPLRTESVEIEIKIAFRDLTFGTRDGRGLHFEEEADLSNDDMLRFGGYNFWLSRAYKREFLTVIFVKNQTKITEARTEQQHFKPIIVQCSKFDADAMLEKLQKDIASGKPINELELVYLPLFRSIKLSPTEIFKESTKLIGDLQVEDDRRRKIYALSIVLASKIVDKAALKKVEEEVANMGNVIIEVFEERGARRGLKRGAELRELEIARNMLQEGVKISDVSKFTGLDVDKLIEIRDALRSEAV
jgi:hypothetical protein